MSITAIDATRVRSTVPPLRDQVLDPGSWRGWDRPLQRGPLEPGYAADLARAKERSGCDEAVTTGEGLLRGRRVAIIEGEYSFLAGSIGVATAERITAAVERATAQRLPLLASPVSGGTRMQEGTLAFVQMLGITAALNEHKSAGLPYLVYLRNPTFGGVLASWGSLGHITIAEPGAAIGFLGPRVYQALTGEVFPAGIQTAEHLASLGVIDAVVPPERLADVADCALRVLSAAPPPGIRLENPDTSEELHQEQPGAWEVITASRRPERPGVRRLLQVAAEDVVLLNGTGAGECDREIVLALARFDGAPCVVVGQDWRGRRRAEPLGPGGLRQARRGMRLAAEFGLPLVSIIDTPGAALSPEAEEGGLAGEIARCLSDLIRLDTPTIAVLLGQGTGGGALALTPADRLVAAANAWLAPLPPEGASAIVHRDVEHAAQMAQEQGVRALDLRRTGVVDRIVPERSDAADEPVSFCLRMGKVIAEELIRAQSYGTSDRLRRRNLRLRQLGR